MKNLFIVLLCLLAIVPAVRAQKITTMTAATSVTGNELIYAVPTPGVDETITPALIKTYVLTFGGTPSPTTYLGGDFMWHGLPTSTTYSAGTGLTLSGSTFSVTPSTYQPASSTLTALAAGSPLTAGTNVTITGTWPALTISSTGGGSTYTAGTGLTLTSGAFAVNATQNITTLSNLSTAGFVKSSSSGVLSVDATAYEPHTSVLTTLGSSTNPFTAGTNVTFSGTWPALTINASSSGSGTVTSFSAGSFSPLFTTSVSTSTTTPSLSFVPSAAAQNSVLAGPSTGGPGGPSFQTAPAFNGSNITNLNASAFSSGVVGSGYGGTGFSSYASPYEILASNGSGTLSLYVTSLAFINAATSTVNGASGFVELTGSGTLPALGGGLITGLNASNISAGTIGTAYLPAALVPIYNSTVTLASGTYSLALSGSTTTCKLAAWSPAAGATAGTYGQLSIIPPSSPGGTVTIVSTLSSDSHTFNITITP